MPQYKINTQLSELLNISSQRIKIDILPRSVADRCYIKIRSKSRHVWNIEVSMCTYVSMTVYWAMSSKCRSQWLKEAVKAADIWNVITNITVQALRTKDASDIITVGINTQRSLTQLR